MNQPIVTVDVVLLTLKDSALQVALHRREQEPFSSTWALPGGYVHTQMDMDTVDSAIRILKDKTGVRSPYLEQLGTFAGAGRDPRGWSVSVVYYAVVPEQLLPSAEPDTLRWFPVDEVRTLPFDHLAILTAAAERIRSKTMYSSLPVHLMPAQFTLSQLQGVYEALLGTPLEKRTFRRWVDALDVIQEAPTPPEVVMAHRPAQHYSLRPKLKGALALAGKDLGGH